MKINSTRLGLTAAGLAIGLSGSATFADSISPDSYSATLAVGESVTVRKTVVIEEGSPTDAMIDAYFLMDTSGSMGGVINAAKGAAAGIFSSITSTFGADVAGGVGVYSEAARLTSIHSSGNDTVINQDVTTDQSRVTGEIDEITRNIPDGGGDYPESANTALELVANNASWRPGSSRFIFAFSDASSKGSPDADVIAALAANGISLVSLDFGGGDFTADMDELGAITFTSSATPEAIVADVTAGIGAGFANYGSVTVGDLGTGLPQIGVSTVCVSAGIGTCNGAVAEGMFDRSVDRTFEFDVTFTRVEEGTTSFFTSALVDGGVVARESDTFDTDSTSPIPLPAAGWVLLGGLAGLGVLRKRRS